MLVLVALRVCIDRLGRSTRRWDMNSASRRIVLGTLETFWAIGTGVSLSCLS
jgi:hypothetical protein